MSSFQSNALGLHPEPIATNQIQPNPRNARTHSKKQIRQIADSIRAFGFTSPVLVDENSVLIAGHGRLEAAKLLELGCIPAIVIPGLSEGKKRALALADNKLAQNAGWDLEQLAIELASLPEVLILDGLDTSITGFEPAEIDAIQTDFEDGASDPADDVDDIPGPPVTRLDDLWQLGNNRLLCGDALNSDSIHRLMGGDLAHMGFFDPPYNVRVQCVVGRGRAKHKDFAMASGEMPRGEYIDFLTATLGAAARASTDGAVHFVCTDWRHIEELITSGRSIYGVPLNVVVWVKNNGGLGSFYRSQHELIGVFRVGSAPHLNTIELGRHGRNRSNVWHYAGANSFRAGRLDDLRAHPTVKPVAMIADAIKDCTRRNEIVLDIFSGSGATLLAAERVGRRAYGLEIDPQFVDVAVRRWQLHTARDAIHVASGLTFEELGQQRAGASNPQPAFGR